MGNEALAKAIFDASHLTGQFTLRSGIEATEYFDKYRFESDPQLLVWIASEMAKLVPEGTEVLAGLEMGGIPVVTALSRETGIPAAFVRKERKTYGTCKIAEGPELAGRRVTVVEDVVTRGGAVVDGVRNLREDGALVDIALCVVDREQGGREALTEIGMELRPLFTADALRASA
ncbi:MAG TPA: orotate phosphoribosyltransferase [Acidimicrobiales bacterium]|nr:orotate phosphoribosyltransferase [Acidimicrobiales bacterium]